MAAYSNVNAVGYQRPYDQYNGDLDVGNFDMFGLFTDDGDNNIDTYNDLDLLDF